jgi:membrane protease YdiL (CAAX protease family)
LWALRAGIGEEVIVVGYLFDRLKSLGWTPWVIITAAAILRGTYHLYQGFGGFVGNIAMGLVFGALYAWKRRLAPLVIAHVIIDTAAFVGYPLAIGLFPGLFA